MLITSPQISSRIFVTRLEDELIKTDYLEVPTYQGNQGRIFLVLWIRIILIWIWKKNSNFFSTFFFKHKHNTQLLFFVIYLFIIHIY